LRFSERGGNKSLFHILDYSELPAI
jgi:hypothetical protein